jgi:hypothetical protein
MTASCAAHLRALKWKVSDQSGSFHDDNEADCVSGAQLAASMGLGLVSQRDERRHLAFLKTPESARNSGV